MKLKRIKGYLASEKSLFEIRSMTMSFRNKSYRKSFVMDLAYGHPVDAEAKLILLDEGGIDVPLGRP